MSKLKRFRHNTRSRTPASQHGSRPPRPSFNTLRSRIACLPTLLALRHCRWNQLASAVVLRRHGLPCKPCEPNCLRDTTSRARSLAKPRIKSLTMQEASIAHTTPFSKPEPQDAATQSSRRGSSIRYNPPARPVISLDMWRQGWNRGRKCALPVPVDGPSMGGALQCSRYRPFSSLRWRSPAAHNLAS